MVETLRPESTIGVLDAVKWAVAEETPLDVIGAGSKAVLGRSIGGECRLDLSALKGIEAYEPNELVLVAKPATLISEIERALRENNQQMAFEPADLGPMLGGAASAGTIGGAIACNITGPRRIKAGAARDNLLGFHAVSGRGENFKSGGRVVKNVTGFDLSKLMAGSYGTLAVMTEIIIKVLPAPEKTRTLLVIWQAGGGHDDDGIAAMTDALTSSHEVTAAVRLVAVEDDSYRLVQALFQSGECVGVQECLMGAWGEAGWVALPEAAGRSRGRRVDRRPQRMCRSSSLLGVERG